LLVSANISLPVPSLQCCQRPNVHALAAKHTQHMPSAKQQQQQTLGNQAKFWQQSLPPLQ
jgi:hypothetical protein